METSGKLLGLFFLSIVLFAECKSDDSELLSQQLDELKASYIEDSRTKLFEFEIKENVVKGFTDQPSLKNELKEFLAGKSIIDSVLLVPNETQLMDTLALVNVSVANIRSQPKHSAELSTQALMGMPVRVLYKTGGWYRVQTPDKYLGYIESGVLSFVSEIPEGRVVFSEELGFLFEEPSESSKHLSDLVLGNLFEPMESNRGFQKVKLPDGREGFIPQNQLKSIDDFVSTASAGDLEFMTSRFLGVPYLWGGTSFKGVDCSGFSKNVMLQKGIYLPRDASQQALVGDEIETGENFENLERGDLLFFGRPPGKVTHVAIYLGNQRFIHSSGMVKYGSFDPASPEYDEFNRNRFLFAKRVLNSDRVSRLNPITFY
ncbi:C40 family peptidase [Jiulongibacter sediminis]|uniref:C40 family peptidase n=1 Tax=Jiulongibacter sediminis TaxID=1605367 RepID=UPI0026E9C21B|nr:C40 family peptidase [Jiulongibacter sediminis]